MREIRFTSRFKRDYKREKSGRHGKTLDTVLMEVVNLLAVDASLPHRNFDHPLSGEWADHRDFSTRPSAAPVIIEIPAPFRRFLFHPSSTGQADYYGFC